MKLNFVAPLPPSINEYRKYRVIYSKGRPTVQTYKTKETYQYEAYIEKLLKEEIVKQGWQTPPKGNYVYVWITFFFARSNQDDNNYYKVLCDSLQKSGVVLNDSRFIIRTKDIFINSMNPRIEVSIELAPKIGRFKDKNEHDLFIKQNCLMCKKPNYEKCRVFKSLLENRIFEQDVDDSGANCLKKKPK